MQLIQPYVQKSRSSTRPRKSASERRCPPVWIQSSVSGKSGARTAGESMSEDCDRLGKRAQRKGPDCTTERPDSLHVAEGAIRNGGSLGRSDSVLEVLVSQGPALKRSRDPVKDRSGRFRTSSVVSDPPTVLVALENKNDNGTVGAVPLSLQEHGPPSGQDARRFL